MKITHDNYFSDEANLAYFTNSQIKTFMKCPSQWLATRNGQYKRPETPALFHGSYVDVALTTPEDYATYCLENSSKIYSKGGKRADIMKLDKAIERVRKDEFFMHMLSGDSQEIIVLDSFHGHPYKCMLDNINFEEQFLTDLKTCKALDGEEWISLDNGPGEKRSFCKVSWIAFWKYPMQLALYRDAINEKFGFLAHPYIAAMEKISNIEQSPNFDVFDMWDEMPLRGELIRAIDAMNQMSDLVHEEALDRDKVKQCRHCAWCILNKRILNPVKFQYDPQMLKF